jgi:hypothetical protein
MTASQFQYTPELQASIDAANKKSLSGVRKQFAKKATAEQRLAALLESCNAVLDAYYTSASDPEYARKVSLAVRVLRSTVVDVRGSSFVPAAKAGVAGHGIV